MIVSDIAARPVALLLVAVSAGSLGGAFAFQYLGGLAPCVLCIYQRYPHGIVIGLAVAALLVLPGRPRVATWLLLLAGAVLLAGAGIAAFHVGVEQQWWQGTAECGAGGTPDSLDALKAQIFAQPVVRCTDIAWEMFGISMAGYNFLISAAAGLAAILWAGRELAFRNVDGV